MTGASIATVLLALGATLLYGSHPNQRLQPRPLAPGWRYPAWGLIWAGIAGWVAVADYRAGLFIAGMQLMLLLAGLPLLSLLRRSAS